MRQIVVAALGCLALSGCFQPLSTQPSLSSAPVPKIVTMCANLAGLVRDANRQLRIGNIDSDLYDFLKPNFEAGQAICNTPAAEIARGDTEQLEDILERLLDAQGRKA